MVQRHYTGPHRFLCVTDDPSGLEPDIEAIPMLTDFASVPSPHGGRNPSCYRRLRLFAPDAAAIFGARFVNLDLDTVITRNIDALWNRDDDFIMWGDTDKRSWYNGSMLLMNAGARPQVWTQFDPLRSPMQARLAGRFGSDQGWISHVLGPNEARWGREDGIYSYRIDILQRTRGLLPANARMVMFHGHHDPWSPDVQRLSWVQEHYQ
jgi:hypothetical protein